MYHLEPRCRRGSERPSPGWLTLSSSCRRASSSWWRGLRSRATGTVWLELSSWPTWTADPSVCAPGKNNYMVMAGWIAKQSKAPLKADSHYCVFRVRLRQTVALLRRDRKFPISALTQSTAESADRCGECEWAFKGNLPRSDPGFEFKCWKIIPVKYNF